MWDCYAKERAERVQKQKQNFLPWLLVLPWTEVQGGNSATELGLNPNSGHLPGGRQTPYFTSSHLGVPICAMGMIIIIERQVVGRAK